MAWTMRFDPESKAMETPKLVGLAMLCTFAFTSSFSTDPENMSQKDSRRLQPHTGGWAMYEEALCSTQPGVGRWPYWANY